MRDGSLGAEQLNQDKLNQVELDKALQELYIVKKEIDTLCAAKEQKAVAISKYKNYRLTGKLKNSNGIVEENVYEVEYDSKEKEIYRLEDEKLVLLATIDAKNQLKLSEEEKARYKGKNVINEDELDKTYNIDEIEKEKSDKEKETENEKEFEVSLNDEKDKKKSKKDIEEKKEDKNTQIANSIGVKPENILMVVEIKDEVTMSRVLNQNVERMNLYAIKIRQDSGGLGSNDWVIVNQKANGKFEQAMRHDVSDTMQDISQTVGLKSNKLQAPDLDPGDVSTVGNPRGTRYVETRLNGTKLNDERAIIEEQKDYKATVHITKVGEDGKEELICDDEHEHDEQKIELPDRNIEEEENEENDDWTPGSKAYDERYGGVKEHRH